MLTVDAELDLSASVAHRTGGGADVDACIFIGWVRDVEVSIGRRLKRGVVPGRRLPPLEEQTEYTVDKDCLQNSTGTLSLVLVYSPTFDL